MSLILGALYLSGIVLHRRHNYTLTNCWLYGDSVAFHLDSRGLATGRLRSWGFQPQTWMIWRGKTINGWCLDLWSVRLVNLSGGVESPHSWHGIGLRLGIRSYNSAGVVRCSRIRSLLLLRHFGGIKISRNANHLSKNGQHTSRGSVWNAYAVWGHRVKLCYDLLQECQTNLVSFKSRRRSKRGSHWSCWALSSVPSSLSSCHRSCFSWVSLFPQCFAIYY